MKPIYKILLLEDNKTDALLIEKVLDKSGLNIDLLKAKNKKDFLEHLEQSPDLILADYYLPGFSGADAITIAKDKGVKAPVIIVTGELNEKDLLDSIKTNAIDFFMKDRLERLGPAVKQALEQKETQVALQASEERYKDLFERVPVGLYRSAPDGTVMEANQVTLDMFGIKSLPYDVVSLYSNPELRERWKKELEKHGVVEEYEIEYVKPDGTRFWAEENTRAIKDMDGNILYYEGHIIDITERKQAEMQVKQLADIVEQSNDAFSRVSLDGVVMSWNAGAERIYGYKAEEMIGKSMNPLMPPDNKNEGAKIFKRMLEGENLTNYETVRLHKDGHLINVSITTWLLYDKNGELTATAGITRDITEKKKADFKIKQLADIVDQSNDAITSVSLEGIVTSWNSGAERVYGYKAKEMIGKSITEIMPPDRKDEGSEVIKRIIDGETVINYETVRQHKDGQLIDVSITGWPLYDENGELTTTAAISKDISEYKRAEEALKSSEANFKNLYENNIRALLESEALSSIGRHLHENLELSKIFQRIVDSTIEIIPNIERAIIHLYDEKNQRLHGVAMGYRSKPKYPTVEFPNVKVTATGEFDFGHLDEGMKEDAKLRSGRGVSGLVIESGETITVNDTNKDERFVSAGTTSDIKAMIVVPILDNERRLGTLSTLSHTPNIFSEQDEDLLERLCIQASIAIQNARLLEAERVEKQLAEAQTQIAILLNQTLDTQIVLNQIIEHTLNIFSLKAANIILIEGDNIILSGYAGYEEADNLEILNKTISELKSDDTISMILETGDPVIVSDISPKDFRENISFDWVRSYAGVPLKVNDKIMGFLNVDSDQPSFITNEMVHQLQLFANNAATAVNNARLYAELDASLKAEQETRSQLIQSDKLAGMGRMVASVAHELNNPLQTIKNCLFLLEQSFREEDTEMLELALSEVERLSGIVNNLQDVYRPSAQDQMETVEMIPLMADAQILLETHLRRNNIELIIKNDKKTALYIQGISGQLKQVIINLSFNAIEAMQPDGGILTIDMGLSEDSSEVWLSFSDSGPGISDKDIKLVFDPFFTTKETGMGLGLSICYDITQNHNGHITVKNNPKKGVTFTLWLPAVKPETELANQ